VGAVTEGEKKKKRSKNPNTFIREAGEKIDIKSNMGGIRKKRKIRVGDPEGRVEGGGRRCLWGEKRKKGENRQKREVTKF